MYIIRTLRGDVKCDYDELPKITNFQGKGLVFLRQGAVNPAHITNIILDEDFGKEMVPRIGETPEQLEKRKKEYASPDIFEHIRNKSIGPGSTGGQITS